MNVFKHIHINVYKRLFPVNLSYKYPPFLRISDILSCFSLVEYSLRYSYRKPSAHRMVADGTLSYTLLYIMIMRNE